MCLITKKKKVKIAKRDIKVWKLLRDDLSSIYQEGFQHELGVLKSAKIGFVGNQYSWQPFTDDISQSLSETFPNWSNWGDSKAKRLLARENMICIDTGFHSFTKKNGVKEFKSSNETFLSYLGCGFSTIECVIPEGSEYFKDEFGLIVSNQLKLVKVCV